MKLLLIALLFLTGCGKEVVHTTHASTPAPESATTVDPAPITLLFENDGCKVYRFVDNGGYHYYSDCNANVKVEKDTCNCNGKGKCDD